MNIPLPPALGNESLEVLLFDMGTMYGPVHYSARQVCAAQGIALREIDIAGALAAGHQVRCFPLCQLYRAGRLLGETCAVFFSPKNFALWLASVLAA